MTESVLQWSGVGELHGVLASQPGAIVLMYHSVADELDRGWIDPANDLDPELFREHVEFLASNRSVVSMNEVAGSIRDGRELPRGAVAITFDDGYLNNLRVAAPILREFGLPATLYLPTRYIDGAETQWIDRVHVAFRQRSVAQVRLPGENVECDLRDPSGLRRAIERLRVVLLGASYAERDEILGDIEKQLCARETAPRTTMSWDDVRALKAGYPRWEVGVHTVEHLDMSVRDGVALDREIVGCAEAACRELGEMPRHFSFPYGRSTVAGREAVARAGMESAVAARNDLQVRSGKDRFWIPRVEAPRSTARLKFRSSAGYPALTRWMWRRA